MYCTFLYQKWQRHINFTRHWQMWEVNIKSVMFILWNFEGGYLVVSIRMNVIHSICNSQAILNGRGGTKTWQSDAQCRSVGLKYIMRVQKFQYHVRFKDFMANKLNSWDGTECTVTKIWAGWFGFRFSAEARNVSLFQNAQTCSGGQASPLLDEYWGLCPQA